MLSSGGFGSVYKATYAFEEKVEEMVAKEYAAQRQAFGIAA